MGKYIDSKIQSTRISKASSDFDNKSIMDWGDFIISIKRRENDYQKKLFDSLNSDIQNTINNWNKGDSIKRTVKREIIEQLNKLLKDKEFSRSYDREQIKNNDYLEEMLKKDIENFDEKETKDFNRVMLESIFPDFIKDHKKYYYAGKSGTIHEKVDFCKTAIKHIKLDTMSEPAKELTEKIYNFIEKCNMD